MLKQTNLKPNRMDVPHGLQNLYFEKKTHFEINPGGNFSNKEPGVYPLVN